MGAVLVIALKDLRQRLRDRSALVLGFIAPLAVAWLVSAAFGSTQTFHMDVGVVDRDHGQVAAGFRSFLRSPELSDLVTVTVVGSEAEARSKVDKGTLDTAFVLPEGFSTAVLAGGGRPISVLGSVDSSIATQVSRSLASSFAAQLDAVRLSVATAVEAGAPHAQAAALADAASRIRPPETVVAQSASTRTIDAISFGARGFFLERAGGTMERLVAAPITPGAVLLGKSLATFVYGVTSLGTVALFTSLVFGAYWGPLPAVVALVLALALVLVGLTALVIALARTERQAEGLSSLLVFGLVLLGGNFIFISAAPPLLRSLSLLTPNGWALRAFTDLAGGADWTAVVTPVLVLLAFAFATGGAAVALRRRVLTP